LSGTQDDEVAAPDLDVLLLGALVELVVGDGVAILQPIDAAKPRHVEQDAAADHLAPGMLDAELAEAVAIDLTRVEAVVHLVFVEDAAERVPVGRGLHRHVDGIVGVAQLQHLVVAPGDRIGAGRQHGVDRIPAAAEQAGLRAATIERDAEREDLAGADQSRRADDFLRRDMVERADLIVLAPAAPILELLGRFGDSLFAHVDIHPTVLRRPTEPFLPCRPGERPYTGACSRRVLRITHGSRSWPEARGAQS
jgi:hypothetical protein